jgi:hypothetical protein
MRDKKTAGWEREHSLLRANKIAAQDPATR